jgi:hypothetical protein
MRTAKRRIVVLSTRNTKKIVGYGASLAILLALSTSGGPIDGGGGTAFAQGSGQPGVTQPGGGAPGAGPPPSPTPSAATPTSAPGTIVLDIWLDGSTGPGSGQEDSGTDEGGDIDEGLSNQRIDPDD